MCKIILTILIIPFFSNGQEIIRWNINSIGKTIHKNGIYLSQSVGQSSNVGVNFSSEFKLNQGFQQPFIFNNSNSLTQNQSFKIYPNPNKGSFNIQPFENIRGENYSVKITDQLGQLFDYIIINQGMTSFNYFSMLPGSYLIEINFKEDIYTYNLIIIR